MEWERSAARQLGLVTRDQLREAGVSRQELRTLTAKNRISTAAPNVFRVSGSPVTLDQRRLAAVLNHREAALSFGAAANLWGAGLLHKAVPEITVPVRYRPKVPGVVVHRSRTLVNSDVVARGVFPRITRPARTLNDLAATGIADSVLEEVGADLLLGFPQDQRRLKRGAHARVMRLFGEFIRDDRRPSHPGLERRLVDAIRSEPTLPPPVVHFRIGDLEVDLAWPDVKLAVEADSARWHSSPSHLRTDRARDQLLATLGWLVLRFTWEQVTRDPESVVDRIVRTRRARVAG